MARKNYSEEFRRRAVELYEVTPGATVREIALDLGVERGTLTGWVKSYGSGRKTAADGTAVASPVGPRGTGEGPAGQETAQQTIARLQAENQALRNEQAKLTTEREILRKAAKYFAGETNW